MTDLIAAMRSLIREEAGEAGELTLLRQELSRHTRGVTWRHWAIMVLLAAVGIAGPMAAHSALSSVAREVAVETRLLEQTSRRWDDLLAMGRILHADDLLQSEREKVLISRIQELSRRASHRHRGR